MFYSYISLKNSFVSYDYKTHVGLNHIQLRSQEFRATDTKMTSIFERSIEKKSIIDTGKRSTTPMALQWLFYMVLRTD